VGDGLNDAPAIKMSDIGVSMGQDSKDTVKTASDINVLKDDFSSITDCIEEGRKI
jgi:Ca2+-transporting ATPase